MSDLIFAVLMTIFAMRCLSLSSTVSQQRETIENLRHQLAMKERIRHE